MLKLPAKSGSEMVDLDYIDFEATCCDKKSIPRSQQEVIEFPSVLIDARDGENLVVVDEFQQYVKPRLHPQLTKFCTELTGIEQETVDAGKSFPEVFKAHWDWLRAHLEIEDGPPKSCCIITCGDWDLKSMLPVQLKIDDIANESVPSIYKRWINVKPVFNEATGMKARGMAQMLNVAGLELIGRHHSGIDDSRNIASLFWKLKTMLGDKFNAKKFLQQS